MPNVGTITGRFDGGWRSQYMTFRCDWSATQDIANRTSTITFNFITTRTASDQETRDPNTLCKETIGADYTEWRQAFDIRPYAVNADYVVWSTTKTIAHASDGSLTVYVAAEIDLSGTSAGVGSLADYITLPVIATDPPTVSNITATDISSPNVGAWVSGKSKVRLSVTASAVSPATTVSYAWYRNGVQVTGTTNTYTASSPETATGNVTFKVVVTDNFNNTTEKSITLNFLAYSLPTITTNTFRCESDGTPNTAGAYVSAMANFTVANVGSNVGTCTITVNSVTTSLTSGTAVIINAGLLSTNTYEAEYEVTDSLGSEATKTDVILSAFVDFSLHPNGGAAFGATAEQGTFRTAYPLIIGNTQLTEAQLIQLLALIGA